MSSSPSIRHAHAFASAARRQSPPAGAIEINESNVIKNAKDAERARQERLKSSSPIQATPMQ